MTRKELLDKITKKESELKALRENLIMLERTEAKERSNFYKEKKKNLELSAKFYRDWVKEGTKVRVTGSRSGPDKVVIGVTPYGILANDFYPKSGIQDISKVTEHGWNKIVAAENEISGWVDYKYAAHLIDNGMY